MNHNVREVLTTIDGDPLYELRESGVLFTEQHEPSDGRVLADTKILVANTPLVLDDDTIMFSIYGNGITVESLATQVRALPVYNVGNEDILSNIIDGGLPPDNMHIGYCIKAIPKHYVLDPNVCYIEATLSMVLDKNDLDKYYVRALCTSLSYPDLEKIKGLDLQCINSARAILLFDK